jgi:hypothetical protein
MIDEDGQKTPQNAAALHSVGRFPIWDLDDPCGAWPYLEAAFQ